MSSHRRLACSLAALLMPATLLLANGTAGSASTPGVSASADGAVTPRAKQTVTLEVLPPIVQQGNRPTRASAAQAAITATIKPVKVGRVVVLQQRSGSSWKTVAKATQDKAGRAEFAAAVSKRGKALTYRAVAAKYKGLKPVTSVTADTSAWLRPTFSDEFSGSRLNPVWGMRGQDYEPTSKRNCSRSDPSAVKLKSGALLLSVIKDTSRSDKCQATSRTESRRISYRLNGHVGTDDTFSFRYGVAAARVKMHKLQGQHASFWLQPVGDNRPSSEGHEIDVIEYFGDDHKQGGLTSFIHYYQDSALIKNGSWIKRSSTFLKNTRDGWSKNYHVVSVQWTPTVIIFRIDGKETWRTSARVSRAQQYLILSLLASDYEALEVPDGKLPQQMSVDWVRVWETPQP